MLTASYIQHILLTNDAAVGRAMVILLSRQTESEQHQGATHESNGKGFSAFTASAGTYYAKWVLGVPPHTSAHHLSAAITTFLASNNTGRPLTGKHLQAARKIALYHHKQILQVALAKQEALEQIQLQYEQTEREAIQADTSYTMCEAFDPQI